MESAPPSGGRADHFSDLPDDVLLDVLSLLPTKLAARTSLLSRRFRRHWECCSALELAAADFKRLPSSDFADLADRTLLRRAGNPLSPLHRLCLRLESFSSRHKDLLITSYISSLLAKAASLGLRHLTVDLDSNLLLTVLPLIFSLSSLESLSLRRAGLHPREGLPSIFSSSVTLSHLKSLSLFTENLCSDALNYLISQLSALEDLDLSCFTSFQRTELKFGSIKRLKLEIDNCDDLIISAPSLEFLEFQSEICRSGLNFHWDMPLLKEAIIQVWLAFAHSVRVIRQMLVAVSGIERLRLDIKESLAQICPFHALVVTGLEPPTFSFLKHFTLEVCFHEYNIEDLVAFLRHSPALESLKLVHKPPVQPAGKQKKKKLWRSMLPRNKEGNYRHAYFDDLHIAGKKEELLRKLMSRKPSSKRLKT